MKFKYGDRVRIIEEGARGEFYRGVTGKITDFFTTGGEGEFAYQVDIGGVPHGTFNEKGLKKVKKFDVTK